MNQNERAQVIIRELIAIPKEMWEREEQCGQVYFAAEGHAALALYFSEHLMDPYFDDPDCDHALEVYRARLGELPYAVEVWDDEECVCLLRWQDVDEIEVAEYRHGPWETVPSACRRSTTIMRRRSISSGQPRGGPASTT